MKWILVIAIVVVGCLPNKILAESGHEGGPPTNRPAAPPPTKSKFSEYISACLQGRPLNDLSLGQLDFNAPNSGAQSPSTESGLNGSAVFQIACMRCHSGTGEGTNFTEMNASIAAKSIDRINSTSPNLKMPRDRDLSDQEKQAITQYLNSLK